MTEIYVVNGKEFADRDHARNELASWLGTAVFDVEWLDVTLARDVGVVRYVPGLVNRNRKAQYV